MKRCTQSDLRKIYEAPPQELTEHIHEMISSLPVRTQEEKIVKKKLSFSVIAAAALMIVLMATALAATNETVNGFLYKYWPDLAETLMPVNLTCEDQGIRMEVISAVVDGNELVFTCSAQDLMKNRLKADGTTANTIISFDTEETDYSGNGTEIWRYNPDDQKLYGASKTQYDINIAPKDGFITFECCDFTPGKEFITDIDLLPYLNQYGSQVKTVPAPPRETIHSIYGPYAYDGILPKDLQIIDSSQSLEIPLSESVSLSGIGIFDGRLHVQLHFTEDPWLNDGYDLCHIYGFSFDEDILYSENSYFSCITWGVANNKPEWEEFFFPVNQEILEKIDLYAKLYKVPESIRGSWKIRIPVRMIKTVQDSESVPADNEPSSIPEEQPGASALRFPRQYRKNEPLRDCTPERFVQTVDKVRGFTSDFVI